MADGGLDVPGKGFFGVGERLLVGVGAVDHRERGGAVVDLLPDRLLALVEALAVHRDALDEIFGRHTDGERAQPDAVAPDLAVAVGAARRAPQRRMRLLQRLGLHAPRPAHVPVLAVGLVVLVRPRADDVLERLRPHGARVVRIDVEPLDLGPGRRPTGPELDPAVGDEVEHRRRLRAADRVVVRLGEQAHAVAEAHRGSLRRDRAVEHLGVGAVRVLLEEVVLDGPEGMEPGLLTEDGLLERVLVRGVLLAVREGLRHRDLVEQRELHTVRHPHLDD